MEGVYPDSLQRFVPGDKRNYYRGMEQELAKNVTEAEWDKKKGRAVATGEENNETRRSSAE